MLESKKQLFLFAVVLTCLIPGIKADAASKWRTTYYANQYSNPASLSYQPLTAVPWQKYTHVIQAFIVPTQVNGVPGIDTNGYGIGSGPGSKAEEFVTLAHNNDVKALVAIVVGRPEAAVMESNTDSTHIASFVDVLTKFIDDNGYDGIDVDWEAYVTQANFNSQFPEFISLLRAAMPAKVITVAGSIDHRRVYATAYNDGSGMHVFDKVDQINFMNYDMDGSVYSGRASSVTWFNTAVRRNPAWPFDSSINNYGNNWTQEENLKYILEYTIIPAAKVGLGVPFYGYVRQAPLNGTDGVTLPEQPYALTGTGTTPNYRIPIAYRQLVTPL